MGAFKGLVVALAAASAAACRDGAEGECARPGDCPMGQACVIFAADADRGVCVDPEPKLPAPGWGTDIELRRERTLDVLFVVDDSPAITGREGQIGAAAAALVDAVRAKRPDASLRVAITTTAVDHPLCPAPVEVGALRTTSCRERLDAFMTSVDGVDLDARAACTDACSLGTLALRPTTTDLDAELRVRPWFEIDPPGAGNLPEGVDLADALRCAVPQGIAGCRFGGPLEGMRRALERMQTEGDPGHGFLRAGADLLIVAISAGNDCSVAPGAEGIFVDNPVFWGDLQPPDLTPAVCWRAGVRCEGPGPVYTHYARVDLDASGQPTTPEQASLRAVSLYKESLRAIQGETWADVVLHAIGGVPAEGPPVYADAEDPAFQREHGIGPGCEQAGIGAPPPVRLLAAASSGYTDIPRTTSICGADWTAAMTQLGEAAARQFLMPDCFPRCVKDLDPSTPELEALCEVVRLDIVNDLRSTIPTCVAVDGGWSIPFDAPACYAVHTDEALHPMCAAEGYNLEIELVTAGPESLSVSYRAGCVLSPNKVKDCPLL